MGEYFILVASQVGTLFLLMAVGYVLARLGRFWSLLIQSSARSLLAMRLPSGTASRSSMVCWNRTMTTM